MSRFGETGKPEVRYIPRFWDMVSCRQSKLLALDYDGTLAPFNTRRMEALPLKGIPDVLKKIAVRSDTRLAVISGRPLEDLECLLNPLRIVMIGSHGFEKRSSSGQIFIKKISSRQQDGFSCAYNLIREKGLEKLIEKKPASLALHTRGLSDDEAIRLEKEVIRGWGMISSGYSLDVRKFHGGVEILAKGWNKGDALEELIQEEPGGTLCVYIGDNSTDEDAFQRIRSHGIGIKVGNPDIPTAAKGFLPDVQAVKKFLEAWEKLPLGSDREKYHEA